MKRCHERRRRRRLLSLASSLLPRIGLSLAWASSWAGCELGQMEIPVRMVGQRPIAILSLNGTQVPMLVDSGAVYSMLSASTAEQLKLTVRHLPMGFRLEGYTGPVDVSRTRVDKVGLRGAELSNIEFLVGGNELGAGIMGILGRNVLSVADTEYDLAHGVVRLTLPKGECKETNLAYWAGEAPVIEVPLQRDRNRTDTAIRVEVGINGKNTLALLDTGAPQSSLSLRTAHRAGIQDSDLKPVGRVGGAGEGKVKSWTGPVATFELGGEKIANNRLEIDDVGHSDEGMVLGLDYFLSHRIYVSRLQQRIYVTWNGGTVFAQNRASPAASDTRYAAVPQELAKDDADALARRGAAAIAAGNYPRALDDLDRACDLAPGVADCFHTRARLKLAMRQPRLALADLDEGLRLDPALAEARFRRASLRLGLADRAGALADLAPLDAELQPSSALRAEMALLYERMDQVPEALRQFDLWIGSHPKDARLADMLNSRCWMRARLNIDLPLALKDCKEAVDRDDGAAAHADSLGWIYLRLGDAKKAKAAFDGAIKLETLAMSLYGRALAQFRLDDPAGGERDLAAARQLEPLIDEEVRKAGFDFADGAGRPKAPES